MKSKVKDFYYKMIQILNMKNHIMELILYCVHEQRFQAFVALH